MNKCSQVKHALPFPSTVCSDDRPEDKMEDYQKYSMLDCVSQLCTVKSTLYEQLSQLLI